MHKRASKIVKQSRGEYLPIPPSVSRGANPLPYTVLMAVIRSPSAPRGPISAIRHLSPPTNKISPYACTDSYRPILNIFKAAVGQGINVQDATA